MTPEDYLEFAYRTVVAAGAATLPHFRVPIAVDDKGAMIGSVSGGCIEGAVIQEARAIMAGAPPKLLSFGVSDETAWSVGLACGGKVDVFVERLE